MGCDSQYKDSVQLFIEQIDVIKRLANDYPNDLKFVTDAAGKESILSSAKNGQLILKNRTISYLDIIVKVFHFFRS